MDLPEINKIDYLSQLENINIALKKIKTDKFYDPDRLMINTPLDDSSFILHQPSSINYPTCLFIQNNKIDKIKEIETASDSNLIGLVVNPEYSKNIIDIANEAIKR